MRFSDQSNVFVYGTLRFDEIVGRVIGRNPDARPAEVHGYRSARVRGRPYPAAVPSPGARLEGRLYTGLVPPELAALDAYEGPEYRRARAPVRTPSGPARAWLWVARDHLLPLLDGPWDARRFREQWLESYLRQLGRV